ncbi:energy transducer TonB [Polaribacter pectinis]|uniref:Energy transducer TonB n=1 Tax=Polaribacter pectinis TaxID=2738844 RepID=A0A7G9L9N4_9FLAO|nr:energy transducer TonB [Polaribacter pectinis]QNM85333.1 energy transducer TonB [Polaribacter pectinis]
MKNLKKVPTKQLEKFSNIFTQLGLVLVLFIVYLTMEHQTEQKTAIVFEPDIENYVYIEPSTEVLFTKEPKVVEKVEPLKSKPLIIDAPIEVGSIETFIEKPKEKEVVKVNRGDIITVNIPEEDPIIEDVPFTMVQDAPVFKGCEGLAKKENKICFDEKMKQFVQRNFDAELANELGLHSGKHKIQTQFVIDNNGNVVDVKIRAPHKQLEKEADRLIKKLPKFKPGKQNNRTVKVRYVLPIAFRVE